MFDKIYTNRIFPISVFDIYYDGSFRANFQANTKKIRSSCSFIFLENIEANDIILFIENNTNYDYMIEGNLIKKGGKTVGTINGFESLVPKRFIVEHHKNPSGLNLEDWLLKYGLWVRTRNFKDSLEDFFSMDYLLFKIVNKENLFLTAEDISGSTCSIHYTNFNYGHWLNSLNVENVLCIILMNQLRYPFFEIRKSPSIRSSITKFEIFANMSVSSIRTARMPIHLCGFTMLFDNPPIIDTPKNIIFDIYENLDDLSLEQFILKHKKNIRKIPENDLWYQLMQKQSDIFQS